MTTNTGALHVEFEGASLNKVRNFRLEFGERIVIGRGNNCDLTLNDDTLSREHVECLWDGIKLKIRDLGSTNGLFVVNNNEKKRTKSILSSFF